MANENKPPGDPDGRRLAKDSARILREAGLVARQLEVLLKRANCHSPECEQLIVAIGNLERSKAQKALGKLQSRKGKYKSGSSHPLLEKRPRSVIYIDESGKSEPQPLAQAPPFFALAAVSMTEDKVDDYKAAADELKMRFFGTTDITFHEPKMRDREGWWSLGGDTTRQSEFDEAINKLVEDTPFVAFGAGIRKEGFANDFVASGVDPYLSSDVYSVAILMLIERYIDFLVSEPVRHLGKVIFESQGTLEDARHQLEYARLLIEGSQWVPDSAFRGWLEAGLRFQPKCGSDPMELADMFARDLYEWMRGGCKTKPKRWDLFSTKIYCREDGAMGKFGVKIFPDSDIRDKIEAHRKVCGATL